MRGRRRGFGAVVVGFGGAWTRGFVIGVDFVVGEAEKFGWFFRFRGGGFGRDGGWGVVVGVSVGTATEIAGFGGGHGGGERLFGSELVTNAIIHFKIDYSFCDSCLEN